MLRTVMRLCLLYNYKCYAFPSLSQDYQKQEREAAKLVQKQSTYKLLADEEDDDIDNHTASTASASSKSRKHFRRKTEDQDDGKDDDVRDGVVATV